MGGQTPGKRLWLARDRGRAQYYCLTLGDPPEWHQVGGEWVCPYGKGMEMFCPDVWEQLTGFDLEPGEGPVEITINIRRKE